MLNATDATLKSYSTISTLQSILHIHPLCCWCSVAVTISHLSTLRAAGRGQSVAGGGGVNTAASPLSTQATAEIVIQTHSC